MNEHEEKIERYVDPYTAMVREFHRRMGLVVRDAPGLGTPVEREERVRLMLEELLETASALCVSIWNGEYPLERISDVTISGTGVEPDLASALRELADLQVTIAGTAVQFGLPLLPATREVHRANMEKMPRGPGRKPLKPEGWRPPDVSGLVPAVTFSRAVEDPPGVVTATLAGPVYPVSAPVISAALQDAPSVVLRQLAGADPTQPTACDRVDCRPFAVQPCACSCVCHERDRAAACTRSESCACADPECPGCYYDGWSGGER